MVTNGTRISRFKLFRRCFFLTQASHSQAQQDFRFSAICFTQATYNDGSTYISSLPKHRFSDVNGKDRAYCTPKSIPGLTPLAIILGDMPKDTVLSKGIPSLC